MCYFLLQSYQQTTLNSSPDTITIECSLTTHLGVDGKIQSSIATIDKDLLVRRTSSDVSVSFDVAAPESKLV